MSRESIPGVRNVAILIVTFTLLLPAHLLAQSPWERAASRLELAFTGPLARSRLGRDCDRWSPLHVRRGRSQAADLGDRLRRWTGSIRRSVSHLAVLKFVGRDIMDHTLTFHPVYKSLHRPLTVCAVERRLFFLALILGAATFNLFYSFLAGLLMFLGLYGFALWATRRDPDMLRILIASSKTRRRYDPGKHQPFDVEVVSC